MVLQPLKMGVSLLEILIMTVEAAGLRRSETINLVCLAELHRSIHVCMTKSQIQLCLHCVSVYSTNECMVCVSCNIKVSV